MSQHTVSEGQYSQLASIIRVEELGAFDLNIWDSSDSTSR